MNNKAFTLVELIVVVTILAILATIGFVSYSSYLTGVRDTNRISQLTSISDGLNLYSTKNSLPIPDDNVEVSASGSLIAYQGTAGANTLETIDFTKGGKDPRDDVYFSYYLTKNRAHFQLMAFLEESESLSHRLIDSAYAVDYADRIPTVTGKKLGILTGPDNTPIEQLGSDIDVVNDDTTNYTAHFSDESTMTGSSAGNSDLEYLANIGVVGGLASSCKTLIDRNKGLRGKDGVYVINLGNLTPFSVYCDMTTDGGGWTYATMLVGDDNTVPTNLFSNGNTDKIVDITSTSTSKGTLSDIWRDSNDKDIMLVCETSLTSLIELYEIPFIIYNFPKSDIGNLEKDVKEGTVVSSENLTAKWNGNTYTLDTSYDTATDSDSMYFREETTNDRLFNIRGKGTGTNFGRYYMSTAGFTGSPGYSPSTITSVFNTTTDYCMSAIR